MKPRLWEDFYAAGKQVRQVEDALRQNPEGLVAKTLGPKLADLQEDLISIAGQRFGALGRLALARSSVGECTELLPNPASVLVFALHSTILKQFPKAKVVTEGGFVDNCAWPLLLPKQVLAGNSFQLDYTCVKLQGKLVDNAEHVEVKLQYAGQNDTLCLRIADFVSSKTGETPSLTSQAKDLQSIVERSAEACKNPTTVVGAKKQEQSQDLFQRPQQQQRQQHPQLFHEPQMPRPAAGLSPEPPRGELFPPHHPGGFEGDLQGGRGGSMLFGPGNPDFNARFHDPPPPPHVRPDNVPPGHVPGARFDPYGPSAEMGGDPDWDDVPMPGPPRQPRQPARPPGQLGGWGKDFL